MATELTTDQWIEILTNDDFTKELDLNIFQALYGFTDHQAPASEVGKICGYTGIKSPQAPLNAEIGRYAKRIAKNFDIDFTWRSKQKHKFWDLFFNGWAQERLFIWQLRPALASALEKAGMTGEIHYPEEVPETAPQDLKEGIKRLVTVNSYERNSQARQACIDHYGTTCQVCGMNFEDVYGERGTGFDASRIFLDKA